MSTRAGPRSPPCRRTSPASQTPSSRLHLVSEVRNLPSPPPPSSPPLPFALKSAAGGGPAPAPPQPMASPKPSKPSKKRAETSSDEDISDEDSTSCPSAASGSDSDSDSDSTPPAKLSLGRKAEAKQRTAGLLLEEIYTKWQLLPSLFVPENWWWSCTVGVGRPLVFFGDAVYTVHFKVKNHDKLKQVTVTALSGPYGAPLTLTVGGTGGPAVLYPYPKDRHEFLETRKFIRNLLVSRTGDDRGFVAAGPGEVERARQHLSDYNEVVDEYLTLILGGTEEPWGTPTNPHSHPCSLHAWCIAMHIYFQVLTDAVAVKKDVAQLIPLLREKFAIANNTNLFTRDPAAVPPARLHSMLRAMGVACSGCGGWGWCEQICPQCGVNSFSTAKAAAGGEQYVRSSTERAAAVTAFKNDPKHPDRAKMSPKDLNQLFNRDAASAPFKEKKPSSTAAKRTAGKLTTAEALLALPKVQNRLLKPVLSCPITLK